MDLSINQIKQIKRDLLASTSQNIAFFKQHYAFKTVVKTFLKIKIFENF